MSQPITTPESVTLFRCHHAEPFQPAKKTPRIPNPQFSMTAPDTTTTDTYCNEPVGGENNKGRAVHSDRRGSVITEPNVPRPAQRAPVCAVGKDLWKQR